MDRLSLQIAQALFRVCSYIKQKDLRGRIEAHSVYLLESASGSDSDGVEKTVRMLEWLIFLGEEVGEIEYYNAQVIRSQFNNLKKLIQENRERDRLNHAIEDIFTGDYEKYLPSKISGNETWEDEKANSQQDQNNNKMKESNNAANRVVEMRVSQSDSAKSSHFHYPENAASNRQNAASPIRDHEGLKRAFASNIPIQHFDDFDSGARAQESNFEDGAINGKNGNISIHNTAGVDRQDFIAEKVRELGKAATKDLIAAFPGVSERTLRYDLHKLSERQIIERIGSGGPGSYYVIKKSFIAGDLRIARE